MSRYAFTSLSSQDFEELTRDLLQAEWNLLLEAFKTGRDSGIDLRYSRADGGAIIIQCKHYAASGFRKLLAHLCDSELPKIKLLSPSRYVVATSLGLTPANKDDIVSALAPFIRNAGDVLGAHDIEGLLNRHPAVERANFKLWLTSTSVLERVLHNAELCQTDFEIDRIRRKLPLFVQNQAFPRASDLLDQTRIAVITGVPGIGKTTLAEMLLYAHLENGYEPIVIRGEVAEGKKLFRADAKQIFYYDDFLGQTFLGDRREYLGRNEDAAIVDFMEMVRQSAHGRFILTAREHILSIALQMSEKLAHSPLRGHRCVLELKDYTYGQKARILYNHLYFSGLSQPYKEAVLEDRFFFRIIKHQHFNPRLIEWLSSEARLKGVTPDQYQAHILKLLESPESIWAHAFHNQISAAARHVLLCLYTVGELTEARDLEPAFTSLHRYRAAKYHQSIAAGDFRRALQELDGAFLTYSRGQASYLNPSVREFVASVIANDRETSEDLLAAAVRFKQVVNLWHLAQVRPNCELSAHFNSNLDAIVRSLARLLRGPSTRWEKMSDGTQRGHPIDVGDYSRLAFLVQLSDSQQSASIGALATKAANDLITSWNHHVPDFSAVFGILEKLPDHNWFLPRGGRDMYRNLLNGMREHLLFATAYQWLEILAFPNAAFEWTEEDELSVTNALKHYCKEGVHDERFECTTLDELNGLRESLDELSKKYGLDFERTIRSLDEDIAERDDSRDYEGGEYSHRGGGGGGFEEAVSDEDVAQMFSTLHDGN